MRSMRKILTVIVVLTLLVGCTQRLESEQIAEYRNMERALSEMNYSLDVERYEQAILAILDGRDTAEWEDIIGNHLLEDGLEHPEDEEPLDDFTNYEDEDLDWDEIEEELASGEDDYPIYDDHFNIVGYGTKEESERSIKEFEELPDNRVTHTSVYKDVIVLTVDSKYTGEYLVKADIDEDLKISMLKIYR